eukprot:TRINITY_DN5347_c0_g1_i1.p1 TRINITY_DN5347_c0_g1~~TRINITY_DN5347_c0_g1_i1.p1  ORF type:complete len:405 (-),score=112.44 TRINITY_DN5347_c0_g1_i1:24-1238(-)
MSILYSSLSNMGGLIDDEGNLYFWGDNTSKTFENEPKYIETPKIFHKNIKSVVMGRNCYFATQNDGKMIFGGKFFYINTPLSKFDISLNKLKIKSMVASYDFAIFQTEEGQIYKVGTINKNTGEKLSLIEGLPMDIINMCVTYQCACFLTSSKKLFVHGSIDAIDLGGGTFEITDVDEPFEIISCSYDSIFFVTSNGNAGIIGSFYSKLLNNKWKTSSQFVISRYTDENNKKFVNCVAGGYFGLFLTKDSEIHFCGTNHFGQAGNKNLDIGKNCLNKIFLPGKLVSLSTCFACIVARIYLENEKREAIYVWGYGKEFSLGNKIGENVLEPEESKNLSSIGFGSFVGNPTKNNFKWNLSDHHSFPPNFKKGVFYMICSFKYGLKIKLPKFLLFEILKNTNYFWIK